MGRDREERNRVFGVPLGAGPRATRDEEPQRLLGFPVDWLGPAKGGSRSLLHPVQSYRRWAQRRRRDS